jgi:catechol 2,3-dioxygenase-like lactoylglutathione lyase family enzyme
VNAVSLHHVSLEVAADDVEATVGFFSILGFERLPAPELIAAYVTWLEQGPNQIHLIHTPEPTVPTVGHAAVVAPDLDATIKALADAGFEFEESHQLWGERRGFVVGPAGHRVEVMAAPPAAGSSG